MKRFIFLLMAMVILTGFVSAQTTASIFEADGLEAAMSENIEGFFVVNADTVLIMASEYKEYSETVISFERFNGHEELNDAWTRQCYADRLSSRERSSFKRAAVGLMG